MIEGEKSIPETGNFVVHMFYITQVPQSREAVVAAHTWLTSIDSIA
jgi:hypothetical protein